MASSSTDKAQYRLLKEEEEAEDREHEEITPQKLSSFHPSRTDRTNLVASLGILCMFSVALNFVLLLWHPLTSFPTDLEDAKQAVEYEQRSYTGGLVFDPETQTVVRKKDYDVEYFSPQSDSAWDELLNGRYVEMTTKEAKAFKSLVPESPPGAQLFEPDMFHSLDCLNHIRLKLSAIPDGDEAGRAEEPDHIASLDRSLIGNVYTDYCLDHIRQAIMCQGDLSPVLLHGVDGVNVSLPVSATHTCRKWRPIRQWLDTRAAKGG